MDCLQSKVFWMVRRCRIVYRPPCPIIAYQNTHFKAWIFPLNTADSLIFFHLYVAGILTQYICWNHWKNKYSRCHFLTRPIWPSKHEFLAIFFYWLTSKCPHVIPKCEQLSYQYIWPTLVTYNKSCEWCEVKKNLSNKSPVDGFPSNYCGRKTVMSLTA